MESSSPEEKKPKPKMMFKKRTFDKKTENGGVKSAGPTDDISFFSRSKDTFVSAAEVRQRDLARRGKEKAEKFYSPPLTINKGSPKGKKRRSSEELSEDEIKLGRSTDNQSVSLHSRHKNAKIILDDSDNEASPSVQKKRARGIELTPPPCLYYEPALPRPIPKPNFQSPVISLSDSEPEFIVTSSAPVTTIDNYDDDEPQEQNPALAAIEKKARERAARMRATQSPSVESQSAFLGPCVSILVTSDIPKTKPLICRRRVGQTLKEVRLAWCQRQGFNEDTTSDVFLTWKGNKIFDVNTCTGMGISPDEEGNFEENTEGVKDKHLHFEAMTAEIFAERERSREAQYDGLEEEPEEKVEESIGIVLKSKGYANFPTKVRPSNPFSINGGAVVAMVGKDCVAIACDLRLGMQALTVSNDFPKIFNYGDVYLGLTGLATDVTSVSELFRYKVNMYRLREERDIEPQTMANLVSSSLYEKRFGPYFVSPVIAGINQHSGKPFICGFDSIGCINFAEDFIVSGTASDQLFGTCEGLWEPDLEPEDLFETISQALLNSVDRDALSGWGAHVYLVTKDKVVKRLLKGRQD
ncbi:nucleophile aminohydrolase [Tuber indicum]|nr:nucleophile aminohydrolase [Tuber indicum]